MTKLKSVLGVAASVFAFFTAAPAAFADDSAVGVGGPGESCRARSDCGEGLKCVANVCKDEREGTTCAATSDCGGKLSCVSNTCVVPGQAPPASGGSSDGSGSGSSGSGSSGSSGSGDSGSSGSSGSSGGSSGGSDHGGSPSGSNLIDGWPGFDGLRPHVGMVMMGGPNIGVGGGGSATTGAFLFALKGGILIDRLELGLELSPVTFLPIASAPDFPAFQTNVNVGYHIPITSGISYPLRGGIGVAAFTAGGNPAAEFRADVVGVSAMVGPALIELNLPSLRILSDFDTGTAIGLFFGFQAVILPDAF